MQFDFDGLDKIRAQVADLETQQVLVDDAENAAKKAREAAKGLWRFAESCEAMVHVPTNDVIAEARLVGVGELIRANVLQVSSKEWRRWKEGRR